MLLAIISGAKVGFKEAHGAGEADGTACKAFTAARAASAAISRLDSLTESLIKVFKTPNCRSVKGA